MSKRRDGRRATRKPIPKPASKSASDSARSRRGVPRRAAAAKVHTAGGSSRGPRTRIRALRGEALHRQTREVLARLQLAYPDAHCELTFGDAYQLLAATILSAQTTDQRVNLVTPELFARYPSPAALAVAAPDDVETIIRSTGFFRAKARSLIGMATAIVERFGGRVPDTMDDLVTLPGVGRKTANVVLGNAFARNDGVVVDTHVGRLSGRLGLTTETDPIKAEQVLMGAVPRDQWTLFSHLLIFHGRRVCTARSPAHDRCVLADICPSVLIP
jgi:endonuclease III